MEKRAIALSLIGLLLVLPMVLAQEQTQLYSGLDRFSDNLKLFFSSEQNKIQLALQIREKEVNSAIENTLNGNTESAMKNFEEAQAKLKLVQEKISLENVEQAKESVEAVKNKIIEKNLSEEFSDYLLEEEKLQMTAELTQKTFEYCKALAQEDYNAMLNQEKCNPETAMKGLENEIEGLKQIQQQAFHGLMLEIRSCIDDPGTCNCENNKDIIQKAKCEKMVALAVRCEYKDDEAACEELESMKPQEGSSFAESFVPDFLMNLFREKESMIDYHIEKSDVPEECYNENEAVKTECAQYRYKKELHSQCFDKNGKFLVEECGGPDEDAPTMQESIPDCYDENSRFMEEKCGKVTIVWNEQGLINYLFEGQLNGIIDEFENKSEQHTIEINGTEGQAKSEIKEEIKELENQIAEITFAPGTEGNGKNETDIKNIVVEGEKGEGDLEPEVGKVVVAEGNHGGAGDNGLNPEVRTNVESGGSDNEVE